MTMQSYKKKIFWLFPVFFISLVLVISSSIYQITAPVIPGQGVSEVIRLEPSASASQFAQILKDKNLIRSTKPLLLLIRLKGWSSHLKAGVYEIKPGETLLQLLHRVVSGDVLTQNFTIIAGTTQKKITQDLMHAPWLIYHPEDWRLVQEDHLVPEGLLLADTWQYPAGSTSKFVLEQAHHYLMQHLNQIWTNRDSGLPYKTPYELLIAASIIEKETAVPQERKLISGVVLNRLNKGMPLQMDPTVIYGLGEKYTGKLSHQDLQIDSPYNSYRNRGLPPTPIAMVAKEALEAAAHPQRSNYLYFVAKGDGTHQFSETYEQQKRAVYQYQRKDM